MTRPVRPKPRRVKRQPATAGAIAYVVNSIVLKMEFMVANLSLSPPAITTIQSFWMMMLVPQEASLATAASVMARTLTIRVG